MNAQEMDVFYGANIDVLPSEMHWCDGIEGLKSLQQSQHVRFVEAVLSESDTAASGYEGPHRQKYYDSTEGDADKFVALIRSIQDSGYMQYEPRVEVAIDHRGRIILTDGLHRSSIMHCLDRPVPCKVVYRDAQWVKLKYALYNISNEVKLYQPINHADLRKWPHWRIDTEFRMSLIRAWLVKNLPHARTGLDMGCHTGNITIGLANHGYYMVGVDNDPRTIMAARLLARMDYIGVDEDGGFVEFHDYPEVIERITERLDFVVCFSLLNHFASNEARWQDGLKMFKRLCELSDVVFYDCPSPGDPVGGSTAIVDPQAMTDWLKKSGVQGNGKVIASGQPLQRTIMVWENSK